MIKTTIIPALLRQVERGATLVEGRWPVTLIISPTISYHTLRRYYVRGAVIAKRDQLSTNKYSSTYSICIPCRSGRGACADARESTVSSSSGNWTLSLFSSSVRASSSALSYGMSTRSVREKGRMVSIPVRADVQTDTVTAAIS